MDKRIIKIVKNPCLLFMTLGHRGFFNWMSDERYLKIAYRISMGKKLDLVHPKTFNEKLQWLKLYNRKPEYTQMVDKQGAKEYVERILGKDYIIPTLGIWNNPDEIPFETLPNQFVLKCTHDSGGVIICHDKSHLGIEEAKKKLRSCLGNSYFWGSREWPYKNVRPRIISEKYMVDESGTELKDYKFFCFGGKVKMFKIDYDRFVCHHANYYDIDCKQFHFGEVDFPCEYGKEMHFPANLNEMIEKAEILSKGIPFVRIDFYNINGRIYFGEITFFPTSGFGKWTTDQCDIELGSWIPLQ